MPSEPSQQKFADPAADRLTDAGLCDLVNLGDVVIPVVSRNGLVRYLEERYKSAPQTAETKANGAWSRLMRLVIEGGTPLDEPLPDLTGYTLEVDGRFAGLPAATLPELLQQVDMWLGCDHGSVWRGYLRRLQAESLPDQAARRAAS